MDAPGGELAWCRIMSRGIKKGEKEGEEANLLQPLLPNQALATNSRKSHRPGSRRHHPGTRRNLPQTSPGRYQNTSYQTTGTSADCNRVVFSRLYSHMPSAGLSAHTGVVASTRTYQNTEQESSKAMQLRSRGLLSRRPVLLRAVTRDVSRTDNSELSEDGTWAANSLLDTYPSEPQV